MNRLRTLGSATLTAGLSLAAVSLVTGFISYTHICALTLVLHQSWKTAHLMPFAVDGQIVVGSVVLLAGRGRTAWWGWLGIAPGLAESLFANWESGIAHGLLAAIWATVAAQAFAGSSFMFERWLKAQASARPAEDGGLLSSPVPTDAESAALIALKATLAAGNPLSGRQLETRFGLNRAQATKVRELVTAGANGHRPLDDTDNADQ